MRVVIVGFPYSGKTALFRAISGVQADHLKPAEENLATVRIPEARLEWLEKLYKPKRRTEAAIDFVDLPGSAEGDVEKAGLDKHLPTLHQADGLLLIVRAFESGSVPMREGSVNPERDLMELRDEMLLADLTICAARVEKLENAVAKPSQDRDQQKHELELLKRCQEALEHEKPLREVVRPGDEEKMLRSFGFLTQKPVVLIINIGEEQIGQEPPFRDPNAADTLVVCANLEADLMEVEPEERPAFMADYGVQALARDRIVHVCFDALGMISMMTVGSEEVRAWPLPKGTTAVEAAGKVHTDMARGFIKAETVAFDDLYAAGDMRAAKAAGTVRLEPKSYIVQDGDVLTVKFNV
ncbi:MAG: YchF family ATPase [Phycisphaerae bacterium]|nr:YchF family ATPase [Phycisphaerae bacterium]